MSCSSALQCVAVCCRVLQCVVVRCSALQCVAVCCSALQCVAVQRVFNEAYHSQSPTMCYVLQCVLHDGGVCCSVLQCVAVCVALWSSMLQRVL